ncbi:cobW domain-containing protein [Durusdinium trenchii]|uniref:CobW domain-containing protein n=1 Tax=Durusdinium trenchii TaxID=1381693 RepID=A0ABP0KRW3_9DINO
MPSIMVPEDPIASATQCYASSPRRAKPSPTKSTPRLELPVLAHPEPAAALSCVPTPGLGPPGTILLAPSRNSANDLDLPMIDQICRSSFQVQKALQRWQRDALAAHRLQWERQLRHRARCRAQVWRERRSRWGRWGWAWLLRSKSFIVFAGLVGLDC